MVSVVATRSTTPLVLLPFVYGYMITVSIDYPFCVTAQVPSAIAQGGQSCGIDIHCHNRAAALLFMGSELR